MLLRTTICFLHATVVFAATSSYKLELMWDIGAPDGHEREMVFINGDYPGPILEAQQGDWVEVEVYNKLPFNTSIHFHGIPQRNTPWSDGVPGVSQRPIQPGAMYTYRWLAESYGSYFYHAHTRGQIDDGAYGPITIRPKVGIPKPFDMISEADVELLEEAEAAVQPLLLTDWRHQTSNQTWHDQLASGIESAVCMDSLLVNGKGAVDCWSREEIDASVSGLANLFSTNGLKLTDKGCVPPALYALAQTIDASALPDEVFHICTPTQGSREIITPSPGKKWLALDVISTAGIDTFAFSIDEHPLWIYAVDAHYIEPLKVDVLTVSNGDRYSVFVELDKKSANYAIRVASNSASQVIDTYALLSYTSLATGKRCENSTTESHAKLAASEPSINRAGQTTAPDVAVFDQAQMKSFPPQFPVPAPEPAQTLFMHMKTYENSYTWALNSTPLYHSTLEAGKSPLLWQQPGAIDTSDGLTIVTENNTWVDIIFISNDSGQPPHPIHKHSNKAFIIGGGKGSFEWSSVAEAAAVIPDNFNLDTPPYRDGFVVPASGREPVWLAVRYHVVNPGAFMLHCHVQSHLSGGMAMVILDGVDEWPEVPDEYKN